MSVPLDLFSDQARQEGLSMKIWDPFLDHICKMHDSLLDCVDQEQIERVQAELITATLAQWGATTNLNNELDPIWFEDLDSLTAFVLAWKCE